MLDAVPAGLANGVPVAGLLCILFWMLARGHLCTGRELREHQRRIASLEATVETKDKQLHTMLAEYLPAANSIMKALHSAATDEVKDG